MGNYKSFPNTPEGYALAAKWLLANGHWQRVALEQSTDGYTVIALANELREKQTSNDYPRY